MFKSTSRLRRIWKKKGQLSSTIPPVSILQSIPLTIKMSTMQDLIRDVDKIAAQAKALDDSLGNTKKLGYL